jgi:hypothetical protein
MAKRGVLALITVAIVAAAVAVPARSSRAEPAADDCLSEPNGAPRQGSHWYYRTDRSAGRRCWYLAPQREQAKVAREVAPPKPRPSSRPISEMKAEPSAEPVPEVPVQLQSLPTPAAPIELAPAAASARGADEPLETRPQRDEGEQVATPSTTPVPAAVDPAADGPFDIKPEHLLALIAAALALAGVIVRKLVNLLVVRRLRRRRFALRSQWEATRATAIADMASAVRHADADRQPAISHDHDIAEHGIEDPDIEESLQRLLHNLRRAAA